MKAVRTAVMAGALIGVAGIASIRAGSAPTDAFSFSESQKDVLACSNTTSESCETFTSGKFSVKALFFAGDTNTLRSITESSTVDLIVGGFSFNTVISDAVKISKGTASFVLTDVDCATTPCKTNTHGMVVMKLSSKGLAVDVSTKTGATADETFENSVVANGFATNNAPFTSDIHVSLVVNGVSTDSFFIGVSGVATTKATSKNGGTFDLHSVKVKSTGFAS